MIRSIRHFVYTISVAVYLMCTLLSIAVAYSEPQYPAVEICNIPPYGQRLDSKVDCGMACFAMIEAYYKGYRDNKRVDDDLYNQVTNASYVFVDGKWWWQHPRYAVEKGNYNGVYTYAGTNGLPESELDKIYNNIANGKPVMIHRTHDSGAMHWVVVYKYTGPIDSLSVSGFWVMSPTLANTGQQVGTVLYQTYDDFMNAVPDSYIDSVIYYNGGLGKYKYPVSENGSLVMKTDEISINETHQLTATLSNDANGKIQVDSSKILPAGSKIIGRYAPGAQVTVNAYPDPDATFAMWMSENGGSFKNSTGSSTIFSMPSNAAIVRAEFTQDSVYWSSSVTNITSSSATLNGKLNMPVNNEFTPLSAICVVGDNQEAVAGATVGNTDNCYVYSTEVIPSPVTSGSMKSYSFSAKTTDFYNASQQRLMLEPQKTYYYKWMADLRYTMNNAIGSVQSFTTPITPNWSSISAVEVTESNAKVQATFNIPLNSSYPQTGSYVTLGCLMGTDKSLVAAATPANYDASQVWMVSEDARTYQGFNGGSYQYVTTFYTAQGSNASSAGFGKTLSPGTTYYYKFFGTTINDSNVYFGDVQSFTTTGTKYTANWSANSAMDVTENNAKVQATFNVPLNASYPQTGSYVQLGCFMGTDSAQVAAASPNNYDASRVWMVSEDARTYQGFNGGSYQYVTTFYTAQGSNATSEGFGRALSPGTTYYYKFFGTIINDSTVYFGELQSFTTPGTKYTANWNSDKVTYLTETDAGMEATFCIPLNSEYPQTGSYVRLGCFMGTNEALVASATPSSYDASQVLIVSEDATTYQGFNGGNYQYVTTYYSANGNPATSNGFGVFLSPGTTYFYKFFGTIINDNSVYYSNGVQSFKTPGVKTVDVIVNAGEGGSVTQGSTGSYAPSSTITLVATPSKGYEFSHWSSSNGGEFANGNAQSTTFAVPSAGTIVTANFKRSYAANWNAESAVDITETNAKVQATFSIPLNNEYPQTGSYVRLGCFMGTNSSLVAAATPSSYDASQVWMVSEDATTYQGFNGGNYQYVTTFYTAQGSNASGEGFGKTLSPETTYYYKFYGTIKNDSTVYYSDSVKSFKTAEISAVNVTIGAGSGGSVTKGSTGSYKPGSTIALVATPSKGYEFSHWSSSSGTFANANVQSTTFTVPKVNTTITANFKKSYAVNWNTVSAVDITETNAKVQATFSIPLNNEYPQTGSYVRLGCFMGTNSSLVAAATPSSYDASQVWMVSEDATTYQGARGSNYQYVTTFYTAQGSNTAGEGFGKKLIAGMTYYYKFFGMIKNDSTIYYSGDVKSFRTSAHQFYNGICSVCGKQSIDVLKMRYDLPKNLVRVEAEAFYGNPIQVAIIPNTCKSIGSLSFAYCSQLEYIQIPASVTQIAADAFKGCSGLTICSPAGSYAQAYAQEHGIAWMEL